MHSPTVLEIVSGSESHSTSSSCLREDTCWPPCFGRAIPLNYWLLLLSSQPWFFCKKILLVTLTLAWGTDYFQAARAVSLCIPLCKDWLLLSIFWIFIQGMLVFILRSFRISGFLPPFSPDLIRPLSQDHFTIIVHIDSEYLCWVQTHLRNNWNIINTWRRKAKN